MSWREQATLDMMMTSVLDQHAEFNFYSTSSQKQVCW